jgi:hypothetical protein
MISRIKEAATFFRCMALKGRCGRTVLVAYAAFALLGPSAAAAETFQPQNLRVEGGEEAWRPDPSFELHWLDPSGVAAVHYRVLSPSGQPTLGETRLDWPAATIEHLRVPATPGVYTAEVWLEDSAGDLGPPVSAKLRFDDTTPGRVDPLPSAGWIGRNAFPYAVRLGRAAGVEPPSGIRGYAVSIDRLPDGEPCAGARTCSEVETDLRGAGADSLAVADLPEGTSYVHAVAVSGAGVRSAATGTTALRVDETDPVTTLSGIPDGWSNRPVRLVAHATDSASGMVATSGAIAPFTAIRVDGGPPSAAPGDSVERTVIASGVHAVAYYARDVAGNSPDGGATNGRLDAAPATAVLRIDRDPPGIAFSRAQDARDPERIEAYADDALSGLDSSRGRIALRRAGSSERFIGLATESRGGALRARWNSAAYPPGSYEFRATAYDLAGNETSTSLRANGSRMVLRNPLKVPTRLVAGFETTGALTVRFGAGARFSGRLIAGRRAPVANMPVQVIERFDAGAHPSERVTTATTGRDGGFAVRLAPGPSREVLATAAPTATLSGSASRPVRLAVLGDLSLRVSSHAAAVGGRPIVFSGSLAPSAIPAGGKTVQLQFRLPGGRWSAFRTVTTDSRGRFRYAYRFADDDSRGVRFEFRAFAPAQAGWPYEAAGSRPVAVLGR